MTGREMTLNTLLSRLILVCVLPPVLLAAYLAIHSVAEMHAQVDQQADRLSHNLATSIDRAMVMRIAGLTVLAKSPLAGDPARFPDLYLEAKAFRDSFLGDVILVDQQMHMLFNTRAPFGTALPDLPRPKGHAAAPAALASGQPAIGDLVFGPIAGEPLVAVAVPVLREHQPPRVLVGTFPSRIFSDRLDHVALPPGWSLALVDGTGQDVARRVQPDQSGWAEDGPPQRRVVRSEVSHWSVIVDIPNTVNRAPLINAAIGLALAILAAGLAGVIGGGMVSRKLGRAVARLIDAPDQPSPVSGIAEITAVQRLLTEAAQCRHDAEEALARSLAATIESQRQTSLAALNLMEDAISDRTRAETALAALQISEGRLTAALDSMSDAVFISDALGQLTKVNQAFVTFHRFSGKMECFQDHTQYASILDIALTDGESVAVENWAVPRALRGETATNAEFMIRRRDTGETWIGSYNYAPIRDPDGTIVGAVVTARDITERKRAEIERHLFSEALRQSALPILLFDPQGIVTYVNRAFSQLFGYEMEDMAGESSTCLGDNSEESRLDFDRIRALVMAQGEWSGEVIRVACDGTAIPVMATFSAIRDEDGAVIGIVGGYHDLRPIRDKDERLAHAAKLATIGEFSAGLAHELAHPVAVMQLVSEDALSSPGLTPHLYEQIALMVDQAGRMAGLIDTIRAFSRKGERTDTTFSPRQVINTVSKMVHKQIEIDGIRLLTGCCDAPTLILGNPNRLEEVLLNLISNARAAIAARRATEEGGYQGRIALDCRSDSRSTVISVEDNGSGVPANVRDRIFEAFFTTKGVGEGLGLGLSISTTIVKSLGGELRCDSEPGFTRFTVVLPATPT